MFFDDDGEDFWPKFGIIMLFVVMFLGFLLLIMFVTPASSAKAEGSWPQYIEPQKHECSLEDYCGLGVDEVPQRAITENGCMPSSENGYCGTNEVIIIDGKVFKEGSVHPKNDIVIPP